MRDEIRRKRNRIQSSFILCLSTKFQGILPDNYYPRPRQLDWKDYKRGSLLKIASEAVHSRARPLSLNSLRDIPSRRAKEIRLAGRGGAPEPVNHKNTRDYKGADDYQRGSAEDVSPGCTLSLVHVFSRNQNWIPRIKCILPLPLLLFYAICWILKCTVVYTKVHR